MDGRKSFVFSSNKNHRVIHEEALLHYFDPSKKGQKFDFQPPQGPSSQTPQSASSTELEIEAVEEDPAQQLSSLVSRVEISNEMGNRARAIPEESNTSRSPKGKNASYLSTGTIGSDVHRLQSSCRPIHLVGQFSLGK